MDIGFFDKVKCTPKLSAKNQENNAYSVLPGGLRSLLEKKAREYIFVVGCWRRT